MKKKEAIELAPEKSKLIIKYITQILSDTKRVNGYMNFGSFKIEGQMRCTLDIYAPEISFEHHLNLEITSDHDLILFAQFLEDLLDTFLPHPTISVGKYYSLKSMQTNFSGIDAKNIGGSRLRINFNTGGSEFMNLIDKYNLRMEEYKEALCEQTATKGRTK